MSSSSSTIISLLLTLFLSLHPSQSNDEPPTAYEVLKSYDFPVGLLPKGVISYELNRATGEFKARLSSKSCRFHIDSYELEYKPMITGVISSGRLTRLKGVSVKVLFLWLSIVEVVKDGDEIQFSVGIASARFDLDGFDESPSCGCGFDCVGHGHGHGGELEEERERALGGTVGLVSSS